VAGVTWAKKKTESWTSHHTLRINKTLHFLLGIGTRIGRTQHSRPIVFVQKIFIGKLGCAVDCLTTRTVTVDKVSSLNHKVLNDTMKRTTLVPYRLFVLQILTCTKSLKVCRGFRALWICFLMIHRLCDEWFDKKRSNNVWALSTGEGAHSVTTL